MARPHRGFGVLPRELTLLGELGELCLYDPDRRRYLDVPFRAGRMLCSSGDGRELFALTPIRDAGDIGRHDPALHVADLYERFAHKRFSGFYNCVVPSLRKPRFAGQLAILHYHVEKGEDRGSVDYVHYFEKPGDRPAYPDVYVVGRNQLYIPRGPFVVAREGITYARP